MARVALLRGSYRKAAQLLGATVTLQHTVKGQGIPLDTQEVLDEQFAPIIVFA